jgi:2'-5' RNA ligase
MITSFAAVALDTEKLRPVFEAAKKAVTDAGIGDAVGFVRPEGAHVTLAYFGTKVDPKGFPKFSREITEVSAGFSPSVRFARASTFSDEGKNPRVFFLEPEPSPELDRLAETLRERFRNVLAEDAVKGFHPHATLLRVRVSDPRKFSKKAETVARAVEKAIDTEADVFAGVRLFVSIPEEGRPNKIVPWEEGLLPD